MMRITRLLTSATFLVVLLGACGGTATRPPPAEREWIDNAAGFIDMLGDSVLLSANGGSDLATARRSIRNESDVYAMLVAYTRFGGCSETLLNIGAPNARLRPVERTLASACSRLERASELFTLAMKGSDPDALLAATQTALKASPLLYRARAELAAVRGSRG